MRRRSERSGDVRGQGRKIQSAAIAGLAFAMAFSGVPHGFLPKGFSVPQAVAGDNSIVRISEVGAGARKRLKLGVNKAVVVDLPADAFDILVADPGMADAVTRTSRRIYLFGKT